MGTAENRPGFAGRRNQICEICLQNMNLSFEFSEIRGSLKILISELGIETTLLF